MGIFGWSYPPGCSGLPEDNMPDPHPKSVEMYSLLEAAGVDQSVIDKACQIVDDLAAEIGIECPRCVERAVEEMLREPEGDQ